MAIQIMPKQESFGGALGTGLGSGLSSGMDTLINMKLENLKRRQTQQRLKTGLLESGMPEKQANLVSVLAGENPKLAQTVMSKGIEALPGQFLGLSENVAPQEVSTLKKEVSPERDRELYKLSKLGRREKLRSFRKRLLRNIARGKTTREETKAMLLRGGFDEISANVILSETLTDDTIRFFLSKTGNNIKKAKKLAKRYGFKV